MYKRILFRFKIILTLVTYPFFFVIFVLLDALKDGIMSIRNNIKNEFSSSAWINLWEDFKRGGFKKRKKFKLVNNNEN